MVLADVVDQRLESGVVLAADHALGALTAVRHLVFDQVALVDRLEVTLVAAIELTSVLPHMSVQITWGKILKLRLFLYQIFWNCFMLKSHCK